MPRWGSGAQLQVVRYEADEQFLCQLGRIIHALSTYSSRELQSLMAVAGDAEPAQRQIVSLNLV